LTTQWRPGLLFKDNHCTAWGDFQHPRDRLGEGTRRRSVADILEAANYYMIVKFTTQIKGNRLELVITNVLERMLDVKRQGDLVVVTIIIVTKMSISEEEKKDPAPDKRRPDWDGMREEQTGTGWEKSWRIKDGGDRWRIWQQRRRERENWSLVTMFVPKRRRRNHTRPKWLNRDILRAIRLKKQVWKTTRKKSIKEKYKEFEKSVENMIRAA
jgi:hypothetical protein